VTRLKRFLPKSLLGRSVLILVTPLVLLQVIATFVFYERHWSTVTQGLARTLAGDVALAVNYIEDHPDPADRRWMIDNAETRMALRLRLEPGAKLPGDGPQHDPDEVERMLTPMLQERIERPFDVDTAEIDRDLEIKVQLPDGVLIATTSRKRLFSATTYIFVLWMVGSSLVLFAIAIIFMRNQVRPIRRLAAAAKSFGKGREVPGYRPSGASEVRQAAEAFIEMRDRIKRQIAQRTEMLAGVSHDLRTPLTRMKLQLAMLGKRVEFEELKDDVTEMERMVEGYLAFARGEGTGPPEPHDISALLAQVVSGARREGAQIDLHAEEHLMVPVRFDAFKRCMGNLLSNAARYGRHVQVRAGRRNDAVEILVDDDGPGIPANEREAVFRPFYRLEPSRNLETGGVGLGLTIARDVVRGHGGELQLDDSPMGGLRARLRLPI
jgi:two-component system, OmpR family, osmolarity sensor histidine kinase EnvZ